MSVLELNGIEAAIGGSRILRGIRLSIPPGTVFCLMGRNGVGKTSTLRAITGLLPVQSGEIRFHGRPITGLRPEARARLGIGFVPQGREIFPHLTVEENLLIGAVARGRKLNGELERIYSLFPVLKEFLPRKGGMLSGGQQQQLAIARALVTNPSLLILDEPTEGIQPNIIDQIGDAIRRLRGSASPERDAFVLGEVAVRLKELKALGIPGSEGRIDAVLDEVNRHRRDGTRPFPESWDAIHAELTAIRQLAPPDGNTLAAEIVRALQELHAEGRMSILLVEQYLDFCRELGDVYAILERGAVVSSGPMSALTEETVKHFLTV